MGNIKSLIMTSLCIAFGVVLPLAFHAVPNAGSVLLPMHIPVLICGLVVGPTAGFLCGALTPALSFIITGMPPAPMLLSIICELAVYGVVSGVCMKLVFTKWRLGGIYFSLAAALISGRVIAGILNALVFKAGNYSFDIWVTAMFVTAFPGIVIQFVLIPLLVEVLKRAGFINYERQPG